jgi:F0F1-type ATP synthase membrane subunit a
VHQGKNRISEKTFLYCYFAEWTLRNISSRVQNVLGDGLEFVDVTYSIKITRKPFYYIMNFVLPSFIITCMAIVGVFTPYNEEGQRVEKVTLGLTALLTMAVILMLVTAEMPKTSHGVPLLGKITVFFFVPILNFRLCPVPASKKFFIFISSRIQRKLSSPTQFFQQICT